MGRYLAFIFITEIWHLQDEGKNAWEREHEKIHERRRRHEVSLHHSHALAQNRCQTTGGFHNENEFCLNMGLPMLKKFDKFEKVGRQIFGRIFLIYIDSTPSHDCILDT